MTRKADYILDFRGTIPPISLLKISQIFREMKTHEVLEVLGQDADTRTDLFKVLPEACYELLYMDVDESNECSYRIQIRKTV